MYRYMSICMCTLYLRILPAMALNPSTPILKGLGPAPPSCPVEVTSCQDCSDLGFSRFLRVSLNP